ncbi:prepilin peptidase [Nocardioides jiangxiensis]|uniref:A24 family peptidase n=1 Tax=Nocardioides jiangxiensis TaxID=3064524 RepID=A0ABT9AYB7_9ACTN|nr:A24 family peptidase [Nocardioides sp. WY-20]MDO7866908.1 A24 family peptidase [Nocardioides sp. WY-20]
MHLVVAAWCAAVAGLLGLLVPRLVRALPEPAPDSPSATDKVPYADLAAAPGLLWKAALASAAAGAVVGGALGADWALLFLLYLCPVGVALGYVDWRLRLLPTALIRPSYLVVGVLVVAAGLLAGEPRRLLGALVGLAVLRALYWLLWRFTPGMGFGDVRLSGVIGLALGYLGAPALLVGGYAGFVLGVVLWVPMRLLRLTTDRSFPFGPFMLLGVLVGVVWQAVS